MTERFGQCFVIGIAGESPMATLEPLTGEHDKTGADARGDSAKRRQILDGARRTFLAQGFDAASMNEIARAAGVSKGTLYVYFKSKEELFEAIVEAQCREQGEQIFTLDSETDIESELKRLGREFSRFMVRPGGVSELRTVIAIADRMPELGTKFYLAGPALGTRRLREYLEERVAAGVLVPHDCEVAAAQLIDACVSTTFKPMLFNHAGPPSEERIGHVVDMAVDAFLAAYRKR
jgi:AcrR family transcriptional regulator